MNKPIIYIAGPFRGPSHWAIYNNILEAERLALEVWKNGAVAICPHANTAHFQLELPNSVWLEGDLEILKRCDAVLVTPRWRQSEGAIAEVDFAQERDIQVLESVEEFKEWLKVWKERVNEENSF